MGFMQGADDLTHIDEDGNARMVDIGKKDITKRTATASCKLHMKTETLKHRYIIPA
jgi:cyclic pyranopterin phosphate synthase